MNTLEQHVNLAKAVANRYSHCIGRNLSFDDLNQAALEGVMKAIDKYDPERGSFTSLATKIARLYCRRLVAREIRTVHVPENVQYGSAPQINGRMVQAEKKALGPLVIPDHVTVTKLPPAPYPDKWLPKEYDANKPVHCTTDELSFDEPVSPADSAEMLSRHEVVTVSDPELLLLVNESKERLQDALGTLTLRNRQIMRWLLDGRSQVDVAALAGISHQRVAQIQTLCTATLHDALAE